MVLAELSFSQQLILTLAGALSTAVLVTVGGGWVASRLTRQHDEDRRDYETRTRLVDTCNREASGMWLIGRRVRMSQKANRDTDRLADDFERMDATFDGFMVNYLVIEGQLSAYFGLDHDEAKNKPGFPAGHVLGRWHQINDLLETYHAVLRDESSTALLEANSKDPDGWHHSGLDLISLADDKDELLNAIESEYKEAHRDLVRSILTVDFNRADQKQDPEYPRPH